MVEKDRDIRGKECVGWRFARKKYNLRATTWRMDGKGQGNSGKGSGIIFKLYDRAKGGRQEKEGHDTPG